MAARRMDGQLIELSQQSNPKVNSVRLLAFLFVWFSIDRLIERNTTMPLPGYKYLNILPADIVISAFTQADGALGSVPTGQTPVTSGSPTTSTNRASLPTTAKFGFSHNSADVMLRATLISNAGEAIYFRGDGTGYFFVANNGGTTFLYYFLIAGSVLTLLGSITGAAANDVFNVVAQGPFITVVRNNRVVLEASSLLNINSKEHGIRNALGAGAVLVDDFLLVPAI
jgi:hypothetical protein